MNFSHIPHPDEDVFHYGVKGMKWGVRRARSDSGGTRIARSTNREAKRDAAEVARAKMYFGDGAGTRRKLINKSVEDKSRRDPSYAKAFQEHLARQDISKHAAGARKERSKTDRKSRNKQRRGAVARRITGEMGTQAAFVSLAFAGATFLASPQGARVRQQMGGKVSDLISSARESQARRKGARVVQDLIDQMTK